jgi:hypothetical protein
MKISKNSSMENTCVSFGYDRKALGCCFSKFGFYLKFVLQKPFELAELYLKTLELLIRVSSIEQQQQLPSSCKMIKMIKMVLSFLFCCFPAKFSRQKSKYTNF